MQYNNGIALNEEKGEAMNNSKNTDKQIKTAIMDALMVTIDRENNGFYSTRRMKRDTSKILADNNIGIDFRNNIVTKDDEPLYKIKRRYSKRKVNLQYKQLKPTLVEIETA